MGASLGPSRGASQKIALGWHLLSIPLGQQTHQRQGLVTGSMQTLAAAGQLAGQTGVVEIVVPRRWMAETPWGRVAVETQIRRCLRAHFALLAQAKSQPHCRSCLAPHEKERHSEEEEGEAAVEGAALAVVERSFGMFVTCRATRFPCASPKC